jgi:small GTP-binding protein
MSVNNVPINNLNIAFIGEVSTGKSTLLNAIFSNKNELSQTSIKRTTMLPTVFVENNNNSIFDGKSIYEEIKKTNIEIIKETESGIALQTCNELVFNVGKLDINILDDYLVNVYDIPGLNDARTKNTYYQYLRDSFNKFNIVIFLVDIHSGLNTSDEIDILRLITHNTLNHKQNGKNIYTLVIVNKADDMQIKVDEKTGKETLYIDDELNEMYEQVKLTVNSEFKKLNITENLIDIIPLCGIDAYLYRMIKKYSTDFELKDSDILKIGINQMGKKFSKKTKENQRKEVLTIVKDTQFVEDMIKLSGFEGFEKTLYSFLKIHIKNILTSNLLLDIICYPSLTEIFQNEVDISKLINHLDFYMKKLDKFKIIDQNIYIENLNTFYNNMDEGIKYIVENTTKTIDWLKEYYDNIYNNIIIKYFDSVKKNERYPLYLKKRILDDVMNKFSTKKINIKTFTTNIELCIKTNIFKSLVGKNDEGVCDAEIVLEALINNIYKYSTIQIIPSDINEFINCINILKYLYIDDTYFIEKFIRFILLNSFETHIKNTKYLLRKKMFFDIHHEVVMSNYLMCAITKNNLIDILSSDIFLNGYIKTEDENEDKLEQFYIDFIEKVI